MDSDSRFSLPDIVRPPSARFHTESSARSAVIPLPALPVVGRGTPDEELIQTPKMYGLVGNIILTRDRTGKIVKQRSPSADAALRGFERDFPDYPRRSASVGRFPEATTEIPKIRNMPRRLNPLMEDTMLPSFIGDESWREIPEADDISVASPPVRSGAFTARSAAPDPVPLTPRAFPSGAVCDDSADGGPVPGETVLERLRRERARLREKLQRAQAQLHDDIVNLGKS